jgi:hypothetical protein
MSDLISLHTAKIKFGGTIAITEISAKKVEFMVVNLNIHTDSADAVSAIKSEFGGDCETFDGPSAGINVIFTRALDGPLRDPMSFLLSTRRKLDGIIEEYQRRYVHDVLASGD